MEHDVYGCHGSPTPRPADRRTRRGHRADGWRIIIPDTAKEKPQQGKVLAVGKGKVKDDGSVTPLDVKAGDTVLFGKYAGQEITLDGTEYFIMREDEILGVIETGKKK